MIFVGGCIPSPKDERDYISRAIIAQDINVPSKFFWENPLIRSQGVFGTCVGFGSAGLKNVQEKAQGDYPDGGLSPLFIYTLCKQQDGIPDIEGTYIRLAMQNLLDVGTVTETELPYSLLQPGVSLPSISDTLKTSAAKYKIKTYARIPLYDLTAFKQAILISPVVGGVSVYSDFYALGWDGCLPTPSGPVRSLHCILFDGYDDDMTHTYADGTTKKGFVRFANSWGEYWGDHGYGYMSYDDFTSGGYPFELWSSVDAVVNPPEPVKYFKVQVGAFTYKSFCEAYVERLKEAGFDTYMPPRDADGFYRVQCGAFSVRENADALKAKLIAAGFTKAFIVYK